MKLDKILFCGLLIIILWVAGCGRPQPVKIGFVGTLMGGTSNESVSSRNGITLAIEEFNQNGGLDGRMVQLLVRDDKYDSAFARDVDRQLVREGVAAIVGHVTSNMSVAVNDEINRLRMLLISPASGTDRLSRKDDFFIRMIPSTRPTAELLADNIVSRFRLQTMAIVYDDANKEYSREWYNHFRDNFEQNGGRIRTTQVFSAKLSSGLYNIAQKILACQADGVLIIANSIDTAMLCQQIRKIDREVPLFTTEWAIYDNILQYGGPAVEGLVFPGTIASVIDSKYKKFETDYIRRFGTPPSVAAMMGYDTIQVLLDAMTRCDELTPAKLRREILKKHTFAGLNGKFTIDRYGDAQRKITLISISGGKIQRLKR